MLAFSDLLLYNEFVEWVTKCTSCGSYKYAFHTLFLHKYLHRENDGFCPSFFLFPAFFFSAFCPCFFLSFFARTFHLPFSEPVLSVAFAASFLMLLLRLLFSCHLLSPFFSCRFLLRFFVCRFLSPFFAAAKKHGFRQRPARFLRHCKKTAARKNQKRY